MSDFYVKTICAGALMGISSLDFGQKVKKCGKNDIYPPIGTEIEHLIAVKKKN